MTSTLDRILGTLVEVVGPSVFDPDPICFQHADEMGVRPVRRACNKRTGVAHCLPKPLNRNAFLCGCLDYTQHEDVEHLIVGLGVRHGATTKIQSVGHVLGDRGSVAVPRWVDAAIECHLRTGAKAEALLFHNHPRWWANNTLDNTPLPSIQDRRALVARAFKPEYTLRRFLGNGGFRFYLGENGYVSEFKTPPLKTMVDWLRRINWSTK